MIDSARFRITDEDGYVELAADVAGISYLIAHDEEELIAPEMLIEHHGDWMPLRDYPNPQWLDVLVQRAVVAFRNSDLELGETLVERILRFGGHRERESTFVAKLFKGHLHFLSEQFAEAIECWQVAARSPSRVRGVAYSNLGTAWALARQPISAIDCLDTAIAIGPNFLVPQLSRRNLAKTLIQEDAPNLPGLPTWTAIHAESVERIRNLKRTDIDGVLDPQAGFPTYHVMHVFEPDT